MAGGGRRGEAGGGGIGAADPGGTLGVISAEPHPPYNRPPLSKGLWKGEPEDRIWRKAAQAGGELHLGRRADRKSTRLNSSHLVISYAVFCLKKKKKKKDY